MDSCLLRLVAGGQQCYRHRRGLRRFLRRHESRRFLSFPPMRVASTFDGLGTVDGGARRRQRPPWHRSTRLHGLLNGPILVHGPRATAFEDAFAKWTGAPHAVATSSCTAAMHLVYFVL